MTRNWPDGRAVPPSLSIAQHAVVTMIDTPCDCDCTEHTMYVVGVEPLDSSSTMPPGRLPLLPVQLTAPNFPGGVLAAEGTPRVP